ncbi:MAG: T9SS type A sorting domain-containing protein [Calditrichaeota bacterium]|nr:T9SS type A sorting domain-containing protein [Calditrichota bacterium]MCB9391738.1 T9SS type A sorting domain-containing protein [Calditrichota bacterium]
MKHVFRTLIIALLIAVMPQLGGATPYWTETELDSARAESLDAYLPRHVETGERMRESRLDEIAYFVKYRQLCDFLTGLQVTFPGLSFGGMREGEVGGDFNIVQTDNTQEAIRVWSQYAVWTGDTARYGQNIRDAWTYCSVWPAWREEGGGYYAMHNCGWGFEAAKKYREAYNDTTFNWYADSCASWVMMNPLNLNNTLNYAAQGLGIGGLYPHAVYRNRTDWQNYALDRARMIRSWFQADPNRLNNATDWALCGGTALWGICNSLFIAYPDSGQTWIGQYGPNLETWESPSNWYNAYNTWYSNATFRCWEITQDSLYWNRGVFYADSLVGFDVDDDGGIPPGTCCISTGNDHSWVSAYMGWMGLERIVSSGPVLVAGVTGMLSPDTLRPLMEEDTAVVGVRVANMGTDTLISFVTLYSPFSYGEDTSVVLAPGETREIYWDRLWELPRLDQLPGDSLWMQVILDYWGTEADPDSTTEEYYFNFNLRRRTNVFGTITGALDERSVPVHIDFYSLDYPDSIWTSVDVAAGAEYSNGPRALLEGQHRMVITPPPRYMIEEQVFTTLPDNSDPFDIWLTPSEVVLVDDDSGEDYESFIVSSLDDLDLLTRVVERVDDSELDLANVATIIWMTGKDEEVTLTATDRAMLEEFMASGGGLLLSGQNISDDDSNLVFLANVLRCMPNRDDTNRLRAYGVGGYPPVDGQFLLLLGSQGAGNQTSPSSLSPLNGCTAVFINDTMDQEICGVFGEHGAGLFVFLAFGIEAISGQAGSTPRAEFLDAVLSVLRLESEIPEFFVPTEFKLLPAYPNPFNSSVQLSWLAPPGGAHASLEIYDVLGRRVTKLFDGLASGVHHLTWDGTARNGAQVSTGTYFVRLSAPNVSQVRTIRLIR